MANVQIYQLDGVSSNLDNLALLACDITNPDASERATTPKVTRNLSVAELETQMLQTDEYTTALDTTSKSIVGAINEHHSVIGYNYDAYDNTSTYSVGDLCIYNNTLYKCTTAITTAEAWNASHWTATSIADELSDRPTFDTSRPAIITQSMTVFDATSISANTEYNSSTPVAVPQIAGYTVVSITEPRAEGYYGSRMITYLWLTSATALNYSVYNPMSNITATVKVTCRVFYIRNDLQGI